MKTYTEIVGGRDSARDSDGGDYNTAHESPQSTHSSPNVEHRSTLYRLSPGAHCKSKIGHHNQEIGDRSRRATASSRENGRPRRDRFLSRIQYLTQSAFFSSDAHYLATAVADLGTGATGAPPPFGRVIRKFQGKIVYSLIRRQGVSPSLDGVSGTLCLLHYVTETSHLYSLRHFWRHFCLSRAAAHSDCCFYALCKNILTYLLTYYFTDMSRPYERHYRKQYKNCAKINSELSTMHMTFTSPERFRRRF